MVEIQGWVAEIFHPMFEHKDEILAIDIPYLESRV